MADKKQLSRSSYDDYIETINKLTPQLRTLLAHISGEQQSHAGRTNLLETKNNVQPSEQKIEDCLVAGARDSSPRRKRSSTSNKPRSRSSKTSGAPARRMTGGLGAIESQGQVIQAVTNGGKIVYGTMKDGKLDVKGMVGEVNHDLLGIESVNAGKRNRSRPSDYKRKTTKGMRVQEVDHDCCSDFGMG